MKKEKEKKKEKLPDSPDGASFPLKRMCNGPLQPTTTTVLSSVSVCVCAPYIPPDKTGEERHTTGKQTRDRTREEWRGVVYILLLQRRMRKRRRRRRTSI